MHAAAAAARRPRARCVALRRARPRGRRARRHAAGGRTRSPRRCAASAGSHAARASSSSSPTSARRHDVVDPGGSRTASDGEAPGALRAARRAVGAGAARARRRATTCSPSRSSTRARPSCPTRASSCSSTPRPGALLEADTASAELRARFAAAEPARRDALRGRAAPRRRPHVELEHRGRLAARARTGAAMSFAAPLFLLGLGVIPLALAALALARRRPARYAVRFPALPTLAAVVPRSGALAPARCRRRCCASRSPASRWPSRGPRRRSPCRSSGASVVLVTDASGSMAATTSSRRGSRRPGGRRCASSTACPTSCWSASSPTPTSPHTDAAPDAGARRGPRARSSGWTPTAATATGDALARRAASARRARRGRRRPRRSCCCPTARPPRARPGRGGRAARDRRRPGLHRRARHRRRAASRGRRARPSRSPPDPETLREIAQASGGARFAAEDAGELDQVYERLGSQIGTRDERREVSAAFAAAGLLAADAARSSTSLRWRGRLP